MINMELQLQMKFFTKLLESEFVMLGAVGGPKWDNLDFSKKPERALIKIKKRIKIICKFKTCNLF